MKKVLILLTMAFFFRESSEAQNTMGKEEKRMTDTICNCITRINLEKINGRQEAEQAITDCFTNHLDILMAVADERKVDASDQDAMKQIGTQIGKDLLIENCAAFAKLSLKLVEKKSGNDEENTGSSEGKLKRIELKGFNYVVIAGTNNSEKSFIWLRQFAGSEALMNGLGKYENKLVKIKWQEIEVYLPQAKGYYKIKEILALDFL